MAPAAQAEVTRPAAAAHEPTLAESQDTSPSAPLERTERPIERAEHLHPLLQAPTSASGVLTLLRTAVPTSFEAVGSTSTVFKMTLDAPLTAAFKAATHERPLGPVAEIAAYRLSRCLGLNTVPPAISRRVPLAALETAFVESRRGDLAEVRKRLLVDEDGLVSGAAIYWIPSLYNLGLDSAVGLRRFDRYLSQGETIPVLVRSLAGHVSTMRAFDYIIGNFDRYSGSNARGDEDGTVVFLRDHDVSLPGRVSAELRARLWSRVAPVQRFSRSFVEALRELDEACVAREFARDPGAQGGALLDPVALAAAFRRRTRVLAHVDKVIARYGEDRVLVFP